MIKTVSELVAELLKMDQNAQPTIGMSDLGAWVQGIQRITTTKSGLVVIDQTEETVGGEEQEIL